MPRHNGREVASPTKDPLRVPDAAMSRAKDTGNARFVVHEIQGPQASASA